MRARRFEWEGAADTAAGLRGWAAGSAAAVDVATIERRSSRAATLPCWS